MTIASIGVPPTQTDAMRKALVQALTRERNRTGRKRERCSSKSWVDPERFNTSNSYEQAKEGRAIVARPFFIREARRGFRCK
jgi:hypothetical protein